MPVARTGERPRRGIVSGLGGMAANTRSMLRNGADRLLLLRAADASGVCGNSSGHEHLSSDLTPLLGCPFLGSNLTANRLQTGPKSEAVLQRASGP